MELDADINRHVVLAMRQLAWAYGTVGVTSHKPLSRGGGEPPTSPEIVATRP